MYKKAIKYVAIGLLILFILTSFGWNIYNFWQNYKFKILQEGIGIAAQQIVNTVKQQREISLTLNGADGKTETITLIEKPHDTKK